MLSPSQSNGHDLHRSVWHHLLGSWGSLSVLSPIILARGAPSAATVLAGDAGEVTAPRADGDSVTAEDAAKSSRGGGAHSSVLREGGEERVRKNDRQERAQWQRWANKRTNTQHAFFDVCMFLLMYCSYIRC